MKTYQKAELIAKNLPTGSYAAGCPVHWNSDGTHGNGQHMCISCERTM